MRALIGVAPLCLAFFSLTGCLYPGDWVDSERFKEDFHKTFPLQPGGTVSVENFNGPIEILGWDDATVEVNGTKYASNKELLDSIDVEMGGSPTAVHVRSNRPSGFWHGNQGVRYSLRVPKKALLDRILSSNGSIRIEDMSANARLRTSNGAIRVDKLSGDLEADTSNGRIEIRQLDGNANVHASNGMIDAEASHGAFDASTSNGRIEARLKDPAATRPVRLQSSNGHIELRLDAGGALPAVRARSSNSGIVVYLPASANAHVQAATTHGSVISDFDGLRHERRHRQRELDGTIGTGGPLIELNSTNGSIQVLRR